MDGRSASRTKRTGPFVTLLTLGAVAILAIALAVRFSFRELRLEILAYSHAAAQDRDIEYQTISAEALAEERPGHYDLVCCLEMLEHVPDPESIVRACAQLVRPGGDLVFSTINRTPKAFALAIVAAEQVLGLIPKGTHDYAKLIRPSELSAWIRQAGLQLCETRGMHYNPLLKTARMTDDVSINYFIHARAPQ